MGGSEDEAEGAAGAAVHVSLKGKGVIELEADRVPPQCTRLDLSSNRLASIGATFALLKRVTFLNLSGNRLRSLEGLRPMRALVVLNVSDNKIASLEPAFRLKRLKALIAPHNRVEALPAPDGMRRCAGTLETLVLSGNLLAEADVSALANLTKLSLSGNRLEAPPRGLEACERLSELRLNDNLLAAVPASLAANKRLKLLDLGRNQVRETASLAALAALPHLRNLNLRGCPLQGGLEAYRKPVLKMMPLLQILDNAPIEGRRVVRAKTEPRPRNKAHGKRTRKREGEGAAGGPSSKRPREERGAPKGKRERASEVVEEREEEEVAKKAKKKEKKEKKKEKKEKKKERRAEREDSDDAAVDFSSFAAEAKKRAAARQAREEIVAAAAGAPPAKAAPPAATDAAHAGIVKVTVKKAASRERNFDPAAIQGDDNAGFGGGGW